MAEIKSGAEQGKGGEWLYRQGELVLGPLPMNQLVEKLYAGELDARTEISPLGQSGFRRIGEVDAFKVHLAKADAKRRVDASERVGRAQVQRKRNLRLAMVLGVALVGAGLAAVAARYLAIYNPFKRHHEELAIADISVEPPTISVVRRGDEDLVDYPVGGASAAVASRKPEHSPDKGDKPHGDRAPAASATAGEHPSKPSGQVNAPDDEPDGLQTAKFDQSAINAVIASKKPTLGVCFNEELQRNPGFAAKIPIEFVIGNEGRVVKMWVDNPQYKTGPLADCLLRELQKWPFKAFPGEQPTVSLSFSITKRG